MSFTDTETAIVTSLGGFLKEIQPTAKLFLLDEDWPRIDSGYFGLQVMSEEITGEPEDLTFDVDGKRELYQGYYVTVQLIAFRGTATEKPQGMLNSVMQYLRDDELVYKHFTKNDVGILDFSGITRIDTVLDGTDKERRSRMTIRLHVTMLISSTIATSEITTIGYTTTANGDSLSDTTTYP